MQEIRSLTEDDLLRIAQQCGFGGQSRVTNRNRLKQFASLVAAAEREWADSAIATTYVALREMVTHEYESKEHFIQRAREILAQSPDIRRLQFLEDERDACIRDILRAYNPALHGAFVEGQNPIENAINSIKQRWGICTD